MAMLPNVYYRYAIQIGSQWALWNRTFVVRLIYWKSIGCYEAFCSTLKGHWADKPVTRVIISQICPVDVVGATIAYYTEAIMGTIASQITSLTIVYSTVYSEADQRKHQSSASLAFVWGIHRGPVNSQHKWPVTWKIFSFDDVIMIM